MTKYTIRAIRYGQMDEPNLSIEILEIKNEKKWEEKCFP